MRARVREEVCADRDAAAPGGRGDYGADRARARRVRLSHRGPRPGQHHRGQRLRGRAQPAHQGVTRNRSKVCMISWLIS